MATTTSKYYEGVTSFGGHSVKRVIDLSVDLNGLTDGDIVKTLRLPPGARIVSGNVVTRAGSADNAAVLIVRLNDGADSPTTYTLLTSTALNAAGTDPVVPDVATGWNIYADSADWFVECEVETADMGVVAADDIFLEIEYLVDAEAGEFQPHTRTP